MTRSRFLKTLAFGALVGLVIGLASAATAPDPTPGPVGTLTAGPAIPRSIP